MGYVKGDKMRKIDQTYQFDSRLSNCGDCSLANEKDKGECLAYRPLEFNGIMLIGEFPQVAELKLGFPIAGRKRTVLEECLTWAGIHLHHCYVSNAVLCAPESTDSKKMKRAAAAALKCRTRLLTEISHLRPRVIIPLGQIALDMITGVQSTRTRRVPSDCGVCQNKRSWYVWTCSRPLCDKPDVLWNTANKPAEKCDCVDGKTGSWVRRKRTCATCSGKLTQVVTEDIFVSDYSLSSIAGSVSHLSSYDTGRYVQEADKILVIPTWSPSQLLRPTKSASDKKSGGQFLVGSTCHHFAKARRLTEADPAHCFTWNTATAASDLADFLSHEPDGDRIFSVDIETDNKSPLAVTNITCVGIGSLSRSQVLVVPTSGKNKGDPLVDALVSFLESSERKIYQNGNYDITVLSRLWGVSHRGYIGDTMVLHHCVAPDEPHNLAHLAFTYTDAPPWKPPKKKGGMEYFDTPALLHEYNARDVAITGFVYQRLTEEAKKENTLEVAALDMKKMHLAFHMQEFGLPVDLQAMEEVGRIAEKKQNSSLEKLHRLAGEIPKEIDTTGKPQSFNPNSVRHLQYVLYDPRGPYKLKPLDFTQSGLPSTSKSTLVKYRDNEFASALLDY